MKLAATLMVQGTASNVGKSVLVAALCRHFSQAGLRVAPFKSQNMSNNAAVTPDGREMGRAQWVQAQAARIEASVEMNPILLKPESDQRCQVVVRGEALGSFHAREFSSWKLNLRQVIAESLQALRRRCDLVVIEGAGSPAEVNLKARDLTNMYVAQLAEAPVLLVSDIDRGGVFASLVGTLALLEEHEQARVAGLVINKFRGDLSLLQGGLDFLEQRTGKPVLGVLPFLPGLHIADEDSVALEQRPDQDAGSAAQVAVIRLPHISNYDDVLPLEQDPRAHVRFVERASELEGTDLVVLPGSKTTLADLHWLEQTGLAAALQSRAARGGRILGICGGCQMLGQSLSDPERVESTKSYARGLGLLPLRTHYQREKRTTDVRAEASGASFLTCRVPEGAELRGYEIHMGRAVLHSDNGAVFRIVASNGQPTSRPDGATAHRGAVVGTLLHGILHNESVRESLLASLGHESEEAHPEGDMDTEFDRLANAVASSLDMKAVAQLAGLNAGALAGERARKRGPS